MTTPYDPFLKFQIAFWEGWFHACTNGFSACERMMDHHAKMLDRHDCYRFHNVIPKGADWLDHYGKRTHDVDIDKV